MLVFPNCADCDTYALVATVCQGAPRRPYAFSVEMLSALIIGWWLLWQVAIR